MTSPVLKLAAFALMLVLVFGGAALAGGTVGPERGDDGPGDAGETHGADAASHQAAPDAVRGLAVAEDELRLELERTAFERGARDELRFTVTRDGRPVRDFEVEHERRMHLIVVRRDGSGFRHIHPRLGADGTWSVPLTLPEAGAYRVFADFVRDGDPHTLAADITVDGAAGYRPLPDPATSADAGGGYEVTLDAQGVRAGREAELRFTVRRAGRVVRTEPYLGAGGHLVALREADLAFLHVHPGDEGSAAVPFMTTFPSAGRYRLYLQFKHDGRVRTAAFTQAAGE